jgi:hypothetical protein
MKPSSPNSPDRDMLLKSAKGAENSFESLRDLEDKIILKYRRKIGQIEKKLAEDSIV